MTFSTLNFPRTLWDLHLGIKMKLQWHVERLFVSHKLVNSYLTFVSYSFGTLSFFRPLIQPFFFMPCGCRFHNTTVPTGRHTQTCTHIVGAVKHDVSLLWFLRQWNYTCSFMPKKKCGGGYNKLVHEQKQYDINCICAFIWIVNRNIKREMIALNAYKIVSTV